MALTLVPGEGRGDVLMCEEEVLQQAVEDIGRWIDQLPVSSGWHWAFCQCRREIEQDLDR